jgi:hypothetical protein
MFAVARGVLLKLFLVEVVAVAVLVCNFLTIPSSLNRFNWLFTVACFCCSEKTIAPLYKAGIDGFELCWKVFCFFVFFVLPKP